MLIPKGENLFVNSRATGDLKKFFVMSVGSNPTNRTKRNERRGSMTSSE